MAVVTHPDWARRPRSEGNMEALEANRSLTMLTPHVMTTILPHLNASTLGQFSMATQLVARGGELDPVRKGFRSFVETAARDRCYMNGVRSKRKSGDRWVQMLQWVDSALRVSPGESIAGVVDQVVKESYRKCYLSHYSRV